MLHFFKISPELLGDIGTIFTNYVINPAYNLSELCLTEISNGLLTGADIVGKWVIQPIYDQAWNSDKWVFKEPLIGP